MGLREMLKHQAQFKCHVPKLLASIATFYYAYFDILIVFYYFTAFHDQSNCSAVFNITISFYLNNKDINSNITHKLYPRGSILFYYSSLFT